jgi:hypothetical protein
MKIIVLISLGLLTACGNVTRPLPYTNIDDPVMTLPSMPGNEITQSPVATNSRIRNGL